MHAALHALDLPYERRHLDRPDAVGALNATGQVPVLLVDGDAVADSTAILARLDAISGERLFVRHSGVVHAEDRLWEEFADTTLSAYVVAARWADERNWPHVRDAYFGGVPWAIRGIVSGKVRRHVLSVLVAREVWRRSPEDCWFRFEAMLDDLERRAPSSGFWLGETLGAADVSLFGQLRSFGTRLTAWQRDQVARRARLHAYVHRVEAATVGSAPGSDRRTRPAAGAMAA